MNASGANVRWAPVVALVAGLCLLTIGGYQFRSTREFVQTARTVEGRVIRNEARSTGAARPRTYYPVFEYRDQAGVRHEKTSRTGSRPASYRVGETVTILYAPTNPADARVQGPLSLWGFSVIFLVLGSGLTVAAVVMRRQRPGTSNPPG